MGERADVGAEFKRTEPLRDQSRSTSDRGASNLKISWDRPITEIDLARKLFALCDPRRGLTLDSLFTNEPGRHAQESRAEFYMWQDRARNLMEWMAR